MRLIKFFPLLFFLNLTIINGQTGTKFWFAAPDISWDHAADSRPLYLHITAVYNTHVTISRPADPAFTPIEFDLNAQQTNTLQLETLLDIDEIEVYARNIADGNFLQNKGFLIEAHPGEITAYYELVGSNKTTMVPNNNNTDIVSLKSNNALGKDFWVSTQRKYKNHGYSDDFSGFVVVATQDNTQVTINPNGNNLFQHGTTPFVVTLNKGQAFAVRAAGQAPAAHIFGVRVTSNKDIAITVYDDSMEMTNTGGSWDTFADQLIPVGLVGKEYIILKGNVQDLPAVTVDGEAIFITATQNNTDIYIDDILRGNIATAGGYFTWNVPSLANSGTVAMHVRATKPVYVNHITGYSSGGTRELGGAVLPSVDNCTGSHSVTIKKTPASGFDFFLNLMVRNDKNPASANYNQAIHHFTYSINGGPVQTIPASHFRYIMDSAFAVYDRTLAGGAAFYNALGNNQTLRVDNDIARFHLGVMQGNAGGGCKYGYFSDYAASEFAAGIGGYTMPTSDVYCDLTPIRLVANGAEQYQWSTPFDPLLVNKLDYDTVAAPFFFPDTTGIFYFDVLMTGACQADTTVRIELIVAQSTMASFSFSADEGCSPFAPLITNHSDTIIGVSQIWTIDTAGIGAYQINQNTIPRSFNLLLPENHTDSIQIHRVSLVVKGVGNSCPSTKFKDIKVKPQVESAFILSDTIGCHPLGVDIVNNSSGHLDSSSYNWDFGDNTQSFEFEPLKSFTNYSLVDTIYNVRLIVESPFGCTDTMQQKVYVHPRVSAKFAADTTSSCSPLLVKIDPGNTYGADTLWWKIDYFYGDSTYKTTTKAPININHYDTTLDAGPDTLWVQLVAGNRMGCYDTAVRKRLITFPEVIADFNISDNDVCDSTPVIFNNLSTGYKIFYEWDFGNNTFRQDTIIQSHTRIYYNRTEQDTTYTIKLKALSGYFCESEKDTTITVHPYINAEFGLNYETNCSPADAIIYNTSTRSHENHWTIGYDDFISTDPVINYTFENSSNSYDTIYTIKLVATNNEGCSDSITRSIYLYPRVVAAFEIEKNSDCTPVNVGFTNNSTGGFTLNYIWEFGDNTSTTDSSKSFIKQYKNETPYDIHYPIKLTARNLQGCDSSWYDTITVFAGVDANFSLNNYAGCPPLTVQASPDCSPGVNFFDWDFGDGNSSAQASPSNTFFNNSLTNDTVDVRLVAYAANDSAHLKCADTAYKRVIVYPQLYAGFSFAGDSAGCQPFTANVVNASNLLAGTEFRWFVDNDFHATATIPPAITVPNNSNTDITKTVYLYGKTINGCRDTVSHTLTAYSLVDAYFTVNRNTICSNDSVHINRQNSQGGITEYLWSYNGSTPAPSPAPLFYRSFENLSGGVPVSNSIRLTVRNSHNCRDSVERIISVSPKVYAGFNFDNNSVCYPYYTQISNTSQYANTYYWDFGDNTNSSENNPVHLFNNFSKTNNQDFQVKLIAKSQYNCFDSIVKPITIKAKPVADFYFPIQAKCPPFNVQMTNNSFGTNLTYNWDFAGDGASTDKSPSFVFGNESNTIADKPITLTVISDQNCSDTLTKSVKVYPNVHVDFDMDKTAGCSPLNVGFSGDTNASVVQMYWLIDGRAFSTIKDPSYRFINESPENKTHNIRFMAYSIYECADTMDRQVTVYPTPIAEFIPSPLPADYGTENDLTPITFANETVYQNNWEYDWAYGDGFSSNEKAAAFTYEYGAGVWGKKDKGYRIPVRLVAWNANNTECRDTVEHDIMIYPPLPRVDIFEDIAACEPFRVDFSSWSKYNFPDSVLWDFGDGYYSAEIEPVHTYDKPGVYTVKYTVKGEGGTNWDYKIVTVHHNPEVDFTFSDSIVYDSSQTKGYDWINFFNHSRYASNYYWYFDAIDGTEGEPNSTEKEPSWYYTMPGEYYVALVGESAEGCRSTFMHPTPINVLGMGYLKFPTAFYVSPDGAADEYDTDDLTNFWVFYPDNEGVEEYSLEVYNRWGVLLFSSNDVKKGWNGYHEGKAVKQDVYIWRARGRFTNGQPFDMGGDVTVIRNKRTASP